MWLSAKQESSRRSAQSLSIKIVCRAFPPIDTLCGSCNSSNSRIHWHQPHVAQDHRQPWTASDITGPTISPNFTRKSLCMATAWLKNHKTLCFFVYRPGWMCSHLSTKLLPLTGISHSFVLDRSSLSSIVEVATEPGSSHGINACL